jgi:hypothetical protein
VRRVAQIGGGVLAGGLAIKLLPPPLIIVTVFVALSYVIVRGLLMIVRWLCARMNDIEFHWPDLGVIATRRRMAEIMALADERILALTQELATSQARVRELETEREGFGHFRQKADARIAELEGELTAAKTALEAAGEELRRRPHDADPLYRRVGLSEAAPDWLITDARRAYRKKLHPDGHPAHRKQACHERFVEADHQRGRRCSRLGPVPSRPRLRLLQQPVGSKQSSSTCREVPAISHGSLRRERWRIIPRLQMPSTAAISPTVAVINPSSVLRSVNDEQPRPDLRGRTVRRVTEIGNLIAHAGRQLEPAPILQLGVEFPLQDIEDVASVTPVIRKVAGRVLHHSHPHVANVECSPERASGFARMLRWRDLRPISRGEG